MKVVSLFSGAGGLDRGFEDAGMEVIWANEFDKKIHSTFRRNFPHTVLDTRSITDVETNEEKVLWPSTEGESWLWSAVPTLAAPHRHFHEHAERPNVSMRCPVSRCKNYTNLWIQIP